MGRLKNILLLALLAPWGALAQDGHSFSIDLGYSRPYSLFAEGSFGDQDSSGLYAKNGGGFHFEYRYVYEFVGFQLLYGYSGFGMENDQFRDQHRAASIERKGLINNHALGTGVVFSVPLVEDHFYWNSALSGGFRFVNVAREINLEYSARDSRFTTVTLDNNQHISGFYAFNTGFAGFFNDQFGLNGSLNYWGGTINTIEYEYSTKGSKVIEGTDEINQRFDFLQVRLGVVFRW